MDAGDTEMEKDTGKELVEGVERLDGALKDTDPEIMVVNSADFIEFADLTWDDFELHRDLKYVEKFNGAVKRRFRLKDTPALGTFLAARVEQYALPIIERINDPNGLEGLCKRQVHYLGGRVNVQEPAYPGDEVNLKFERVRPLNPKTEVHLFPEQQFGKVVVLEVAAKKCKKVNHLVYEIFLGTNKPNLGYKVKDHFLARTDLSSPRFDGIEISKDVFRRKDGGQIEDPLLRMSGCLGVQEKAEIPFGWYAGFIPSCLLDIFKRSIPEGGIKEAGEDGKKFPIGMLMSTNFRYYEKPEFGSIKVITLKPNKDQKWGRGRKNYYEFESVIYQKNTEQPIVQGTTRLFSNFELKFD